MLGELGSGGVAEVHDAVDVKIGRPVALKTLLPAYRGLLDARQRLLREGHLGALLCHPHVCGVSDVGLLEDGSPYVVMERLEGITAADHLRTRGALPLGTALTVASQITSALGAAHGRGIVHRDVKAANVLLVHRCGLAPLAKLLDFGIAQCPSGLSPWTAFDAPVPTQLTAAGLVVGTPEYMSPEQASGRRDLDGRSDLYQVGVFLYEALTGALPCSGATHGELLRRIVRGDVAPLSSYGLHLPAGVVELVHRALATLREERFQTAEELVDALSAVTPRNAPPPVRIAGTGDEPEPTTAVRLPHGVGGPEVRGNTGVTLPVSPRERIR